MKEFDVTITETLKLTVSVEASSKEEAEQMVNDQWRAGDHVLDADNFVDVKFESNEGKEISAERETDNTMEVLMVEPGQYPRMEGKLTFADGETRQGKYVKCDFLPTPLELFTLTFPDVCPNAQKFINANEDLFYGYVADIPDDLKDKEFNLAQFKKSPNSNIKGVIEVNSLIVG